LVYRVGGENLSVTESAFVASWFKGKELSLALGIDLCVSRLASSINDITQPFFYAASGYKLSLGFWFGFILCLVSVGCALALVMMDIKADKSCITKEVPIVRSAVEDKEEEDEEAEEEIKISDIKHFPKIYWLLAGSCVMMYMSFMSFMNIGSDFLQLRFNFDEEVAGAVLVKTY